MVRSLRPCHTARTALLAAALTMGMAVPVTWAAAPAPLSHARNHATGDPAAVRADLQSGRVQALVQQQRQWAARLLARAETDLQRRRLPPAVERYEVAWALDASIAQRPRAAALQAARSRLRQARDAVARCMQARDAACMDRAVRNARALAPRDPALALLTLQASAWWVPGQTGRTASVEGTTSSR